MTTPRTLDLYRYAWRLPLLIWQGAFFVIPLLFMAAMSFWLVKNYKMEPDFVLDNWSRMLGRGAFWDAYHRPSPFRRRWSCHFGCLKAHGALRCCA